MAPALSPPAARGVRKAPAAQEAADAQQLALSREQVRDLRRRLRAQRREAARLQVFAAEVQSLQALACVIRRARRPGDIFRTLRECAARVLDFDDCELFFLPDSPAPLTPLRRRRVHDALRVAALGLLEEGIVDWILQARRPVVVPDLTTLPSSGTDEHASHYVVVPMVLNGQGIGIFVLYTGQCKDAITAEALDSLLLLTEHAAVAIAHLRLQRRSRSRPVAGSMERRHHAKCH